MIIIYVFLIIFIIFIIFNGKFRNKLNSVKKYLPQIRGNLRSWTGLGIVKGREFVENMAVSTEGPPSPTPSIPIKFLKDRKGVIQGLNIGGYEVPMDSIPPEINIDFKRYDQVQSVLDNKMEPMVSGPKFEKGELNSLCGTGRNIEIMDNCRKGLEDLNIKTTKKLIKTSRDNRFSHPSGCWVGRENATDPLLFGFNEVKHKIKMANYRPICWTKGNVRHNLQKNALGVKDVNNEIFLLGSDKADTPFACKTDGPAETKFTTQQDYVIKVSGFSHTRPYSGRIDTTSLKNAPKSSQILMDGCGFLCNGSINCDNNMKIQISNLTPNKLYHVNLWGWEVGGSVREDVKFSIEHVEKEAIVGENISTISSTMPPKPFGTYSGPFVSPYFVSNIRSSDEGVITLKYKITDKGKDGKAEWHGHVSLGAIQIFE